VELVVVGVLDDSAVLRPEDVGRRLRLDDALELGRLSADDGDVAQGLERWRLEGVKREGGDPPL
jgi:hypothetical protein